MILDLDTRLFALLNSVSLKSPILDAIIFFIACIFPYILVLAFLIILPLLKIEGKQKMRILGAIVLSEIIAFYVVNNTIRFFYERARPFVDHQVSLVFTQSGLSFPSGHATFFFAFATVTYLFLREERRYKWLTRGLYVAAVLIASARVVGGVHYPLDIVAGAVVGILVAWIVHKCLSISFYPKKK